MSDWLNDGNDYLALDEPPMPDGAPAPPTGPAGDGAVADTGGAWLGGDLDAPAGAPAADPFAPDPFGLDPFAPAEHGGATLDAAAHAPVPTAPPPVASTPAPAPNPYYAQAAPPVQHDLSVAAPQLQDVTPSVAPIGGQRGELSSLVLDVEVDVEVGLGNAALTVEEFLEMGRGSVVELDTPIDALIELKVRGKLVARGQLVSVNGKYGMRILEMHGEDNDR